MSKRKTASAKAKAKKAKAKTRPAKRSAKATTAKRSTKSAKRSKTQSARRAGAKPAARAKTVKKKAAVKKSVRSKSAKAKRPTPAAKTNAKASGRKASRASGSSASTAATAATTTTGSARKAQATKARPSNKPKPTVRQPVAVLPNAAAAEEARSAPTVEQLRKVKTGLTKRDRDRYRQLLLDKRTEIVGDVTSMQSDARKQNEDGNLSHMPVHMADVGSDNYEQEFTLGLVESERRLLREIDEALRRLGNGTYGVCIERAVPIGRARLDAKPWAKYCIEVARERESRPGQR